MTLVILHKSMEKANQKFYIEELASRIRKLVHYPKTDNPIYIKSNRLNKCTCSINKCNMFASLSTCFFSSKTNQWTLCLVLLSKILKDLCKWAWINLNFRFILEGNKTAKNLLDICIIWRSYTRMIDSNKHDSEIWRKKCFCP